MTCNSGSSSSSTSPHRVTFLCQLKLMMMIFFYTPQDDGDDLQVSVPLIVCSYWFVFSRETFLRRLLWLIYEIVSLLITIYLFFHFENSPFSFYHCLSELQPLMMPPDFFHSRQWSFLIRLVCCRMQQFLLFGLLWQQQTHRLLHNPNEYYYFLRAECEE